MLDLLITILLSMGLNFGYTDNGQLQISKGTSDKVQTSLEYQDGMLDQVVINDDISAGSDSKE